MKAKFECDVCGHIHEADEKWKDREDGWKCPTCESDKSYFKITTVVRDKGKETEAVNIGVHIPKESPIAEYVDAITEMAETGKSIIEPMCSTIPTLSWNDLLIKGAQAAKIPLNDDVPVNTKTVVGPRALTPLEIETPIYITHMSFGALSREAKIALAKGSAAAKTAMCSGEGGILQESLDNAYKYILELVPNQYSATEENLKKVDAVEIKIGQSAKPGMGGHLPSEKVTEEIAEVRGFQKGKEIISPAHFPDITSKEQLRAKVQWLREKTGGKPIGIKIAAGNIEDDLDVVVYAEPDFITIDGRPGATAASPKYVKDATSIPTVPALYRARKYLDAHKIKDISLIITGGLRVSSDFAKALAMGADAIAIGTAALIACGCRQYRICHTGKCPTGLTAQDKNLRKRVDIDKSAKQLANFLNVCTEELRCFARLTGNKDVHNLSMLDLCTTSTEISDYTEIQHVFETLEEVTQWVRLKKI
ncbi:glutamate synthase [candidate division WOR_3 bacterium SM23_60]|uniref:Glutamate synthase n=1 Tax=candidate division WOR_3 bacterium SM23_60 TaxID=1703780 RepID=A0A0S8G6N6_UNCW3|nr:MAG: glutamate synthase [candidate division WOR_3 bacterium SM23_60]